MKRKNLFINMWSIFLIGLGIFLFLIYALGEESNTSQNIEVTQEEEASVFSPIEPAKEQTKEEINLKLSESLPLFLPEEE